jgi:hypothetical protein
MRRRFAFHDVMLNEWNIVLHSHNFLGNAPFVKAILRTAFENPAAAVSQRLLEWASRSPPLLTERSFWESGYMESRLPAHRSKQPMKPSQIQIRNGIEEWSDGTISSAANGYQAFFHATPEIFTQFHPFQHFGTAEAAAARAAARPSLSHTTHKVWLAIRNPLTTIDDQAANNVGQLVGRAVDGGILDKTTADRIDKDMQATQEQWHLSGNWSASKWQFSMGVFAKELSSLNYDGLVYENTVEGGFSYVPFRSDQIWWCNRPRPEP